MCRAEFFLFLVLGSLIHLKISAKNADPEFSKLKNPRNEMNPVIFGKPLSEVEESVKRFILTLSQPASKSLTQTLQQTSLKGNNINNLVTIATKVVVENLRSFGRKLGILKNENQPEIITPGKNETFTDNLIISGLALVCDIVDLLITGSDYLGSEYVFQNQTVESKSTDSNWKKPTYMDFIIFYDDLAIYMVCMSEDSYMDDFKKAVTYGSTHSANEVIDYLKKNIKKPPASRKLKTIEYICSLIEDIRPGGYEKCISDWDNIQSCFAFGTEPSSKNRSFLKFMKQLFPRKWVNSVVDLDKSCKLKKDQEFECKIRKRPLGTRRQVEFIVRTITGKSITRRSPLSKAIRLFSRIISKSPVAKSIVQDCTDYILIYNQGKERKTKLKKKSENDPKEFKRYQKVSKSLDNFKNGVTHDLLNAIVEFNQIPIYVEKSLSKVEPKFFEWSSFSSALSSLSQWIYSLYGNKSTNKNYGVSYDQKTQGLIEIREEAIEFMTELLA